MPKDRAVANNLQRRFRDLAKRFKAAPLLSCVEDQPARPTEILKRFENFEEGGCLVIEAVHAGFLGDVPHLLALVAWVEGRGAHPLWPKLKPNMPAGVTPCPANVFFDLSGGPDGGLLVQCRPDAFTRNPYFRKFITEADLTEIADLGRAHAETELRRHVRTCRVLADMIEAEAVSKARQAWWERDEKAGDGQADGQAHGVGKPPVETPTGKMPRRNVRAPTARQRQIATFYENGTLNQTEVATYLTQHLPNQKKPISQPTVSRAIRAMNRWRAANPDLNLPQIPTRKRKVADAVDHDVIDMGARTDHHTPRQRQRRKNK